MTIVARCCCCSWYCQPSGEGESHRCEHLNVSFRATHTFQSKTSENANREQNFCCAYTQCSPHRSSTLISPDYSHTLTSLMSTLLFKKKSVDWQSVGYELLGEPKLLVLRLARTVERGVGVRTNGCGHLRMRLKNGRRLQVSRKRMTMMRVTSMMGAAQDRPCSGTAVVSRGRDCTG